MRLVRFLIPALLLAPSLAWAQIGPTRQGFGISLGIGAGSAGASCDGCSSERDNGLSGYLRIGGHLSPTLFLGAESNGWVHSEDGIDETLGFLMGVAQWYPNASSGLSLKGGLGLASYLATDGSDDITASGLALSVGIGYDFRVANNFSLTPYANFLKSTQAELKFNDVSTNANMSANVFQFGLGFTWH
jgi:hypothetical protein